MRRLLLGVMTLVCAMLIGGAANGQITLVPGSPQLVAQAPKYIAVADFNNDQFEDVVVSNSVSSKVTVLLGQAGNTFGAAVDLNVGRTVRGVSAGDLNSDGKPDIAIVDYVDSEAFYVTGNGDGTFNQPVGKKVGLHPIDVGIGNFDGKLGNDIMTVDETVNKVSVLLNQGGNKGFTEIGQFNAGNVPKRGKVADLNGDGFDDIIVVNTGTGAADDVSVLLNTGNGSFLSTPPENFVVGAGAKDVVIADFNGDGVPDLAVLSAGLATAVQRQLAITILINQTVQVNGKTVGTGFFNLVTPIILGCPLSLNGTLLTTCTPNFIAAADFDNDGFTDLAVSFNTLGRSQGRSVNTSGLVMTYKGHGDGTFDFSSQVTVGVNPQGVAVGDFNGDGYPDLAVAEQGSRSVRVLTSIPPPPLDDGKPCHIDRQCASNFCVDGICCSTSTCAAGLFCNIPDTGGVCSPPAPIGNSCTLGQQCNSDFCVDGFCCSTRNCPSGQFCNSGACAPPAPLGVPCNAIDQCTSGHCTDGVCCADDRCPAGESCNIPTFEGTCMAKLPIGRPCTVDGQCVPPTSSDSSGFCTDLFCCEKAVCPAGQACNIPGREGNCSLQPTATVTPTPTPTPQPNGAVCGFGSQCASTFCVDDTCCSSSFCPVSDSGLQEFCDVLGSPGTCTTRRATGDQCQHDTDCQTLNCSPSLTCGPLRTPTPLGAGSGCSSDSQCAAGLVCSSDESVCCTSRTCQTGFSCKNSSGNCTIIPTPTQTPSGVGAQCGSNVCQVGLFCTDGVCCNESSCTAPERCDIFGLQGECNQPLDPGVQCLVNTDCNADFGLTCAFCSSGPPDCAVAGERFCAVAIATPTFTAAVPTPTPQCPAGFVRDAQTGTCELTARSGGCAIDNGTDGGSAWLLAALPLLFVLRRSRLQAARAGRRRAGR